MQLANNMRGFTLLEVLVSMAIFTFAMLGIASLHMTSLQDTNASFLRSQAVIISDDLVERLRSHPSLLDYAVTNGVDSTKTYANVASCYGGAGCSASQLATSELSQWAKRLQQLGESSSTTNPTSPPVNVKLTHQGNQLFNLKITWVNKQWKEATTTQAAHRENAASTYELLVAIH